MNDSSKASSTVISDMTRHRGVRSDSFDFAYLVRRANDLGARTDEERAEKAGISIATYYRYQRGKDPSLKRLKTMAKNLGTTRARLMGEADE